MVLYLSFIVCPGASRSAGFTKFVGIFCERGRKGKFRKMNTSLIPHKVIKNAFFMWTLKKIGAYGNKTEIIKKQEEGV